MMDIEDAINKDKTQSIQQEASEELPPIVRLENWERLYNDSNSPNLRGDAYGHPNFTDGQSVITSRLQWISEGACLAQTVSRLYALGRKK